MLASLGLEHQMIDLASLSGNVCSVGQHPILIYILHAPKRQGLSLLASLFSLRDERVYFFCSIRGHKHSITESDFFTYGVTPPMYKVSACYA